jgi:hypothetical protein
MIYRPPNSGHENMDELCKLIEIAPQDAIFIGDFNAPDVDWANEKSGPRSRKLLEAVQEADMSQLIAFSTHDRGNILDLVITNCCERIINIEEAGKLGNSDHCALIIDVKMSIMHNEKSINKPDWVRANYNEIRNALRETNWNQILKGTAEQDWQSLRNILTECTEQFVPRKRTMIN